MSGQLGFWTKSLVAMEYMYLGLAESERLVPLLTSPESTPSRCRSWGLANREQDGMHE
jgi:hypothetical protein